MRLLVTLIDREAGNIMRTHSWIWTVAVATGALVMAGYLPAQAAPSTAAATTSVDAPAVASTRPAVTEASSAEPVRASENTKEPVRTHRHRRHHTHRHITARAAAPAPAARTEDDSRRFWLPGSRPSDAGTRPGVALPKMNM